MNVKPRSPSPRGDRYKWGALVNTTLGMLMASIDGSIMLISLPDIFRGIHLDPLQPGNSFYLLWMILSFLVVTSVLVVNLGRLGDIYGRVRMYNLGFATFTFFSLLLTITWMTGTAAGMWLIVVRVFQGIGAAFLVANSSAILTDAFPEDQRGMALGINQAAAISGTFIGLVLGGILAPINWRLIFLVSVPIGLFGTVWGYRQLREVDRPTRARIDWPGNLTFAFGLVTLMIGITYGIEPHGGHTMGWTAPAVLGELGVGIALLIAFAIIETRVADPMFRLPLFRIRAFTAGVLASFLAAVGRGGLMFMLIIWLQGIWLPLHGYNFARTPLWAGIAMLPLTAGFLIAGPVSGVLSDRYGARPFATGGMLGSAAAFVALELLPVNFSYWVFGLILLILGLTMGAFGSPNRAGVMNSLPPQHRGAGSGMNSTFQNSAQVLSIGIFFTLMIVGLSSSLPTAMYHGLVTQGVPTGVADRVAHLPPVSTLFAAFLGYNPMQHLLGTTVLARLPAAHRAVVTGRAFFPNLIAVPFRNGLHAAFDFAIVACLVAAAASWMRGGKYVYLEPVSRARRAGVGSRGGEESDDRDERDDSMPVLETESDMTGRRVPEPPAPDEAHTLRIGEVAQLCGVTTRTLRYWEEIGLVAPSEPRHGGERVYAGSEVERARRIRELQAHMGFSLAEIRVVLETEDVLDELRNAYKANARPELRRRLLRDAMEANDNLVVRLDDTLARVKAFRDERAAKAKRMRARAAELDREIEKAAIGRRR